MKFHQPVTVGTVIKLLGLFSFTSLFVGALVIGELAKGANFFACLGALIFYLVVSLAAISARLNDFSSDPYSRMSEELGPASNWRYNEWEHWDGYP